MNQESTKFTDVKKMWLTDDDDDDDGDDDY